MHPLAELLLRVTLPEKMLIRYLTAALEKPPGNGDFPSDSGHDADRGHLCVFDGISRRLSKGPWEFRHLFKEDRGKPALLLPSQITCSANPELRFTTWEEFCRQEGENTTPDYGCRSHSDFMALDRRLPGERSVKRWGQEIIWSGDGNHRIAAMAHFQRNNPHQGFAVDVTISDYRLNTAHPLASHKFGLLREREGAAPTIHGIAKLFRGLDEGIEIHSLRDGVTATAYDSEKRFVRTHLLVFAKPTALSICMERFVRENSLYWDLRRYFGIH